MLVMLVVNIDDHYKFTPNVSSNVGNTSNIVFNSTNNQITCDDNSTETEGTYK